MFLKKSHVYRRFVLVSRDVKFERQTDEPLRPVDKWLRNGLFGSTRPGWSAVTLGFTQQAACQLQSWSLAVLSKLMRVGLRPLRSGEREPQRSGEREPQRCGLFRRGGLGPRRPRAQRAIRITWGDNKESSPNTNTGYQPNIKSCPNIDIPRISNLS